AVESRWLFFSSGRAHTSTKRDWSSDVCSSDLFRPVSEENRREGWHLAHWLIAHADDLDIQYVIFDDLGWSAHSFGGQWHDYEVADPDNAILRHLDHVHVDVLGGDASDGS